MSVVTELEAATVAARPVFVDPSNAKGARWFALLVFVSLLAVAFVAVVSLLAADFAQASGCHAWSDGMQHVTSTRCR